MKKCPEIFAYFGKYLYLCTAFYTLRCLSYRYLKICIEERESSML